MLLAVIVSAGTLEPDCIWLWNAMDQNPPTWVNIRIAGNLHSIDGLVTVSMDPHLRQDDWAHEMKSFWPMGEHAAVRRLEEWLKDAAWGCYFPPGRDVGR